MVYFGPSTYSSSRSNNSPLNGYNNQDQNKYYNNRAQAGYQGFTPHSQPRHREYGSHFAPGTSSNFLNQLVKPYQRKPGFSSNGGHGYSHGQSLMGVRYPPSTRNGAPSASYNGSKRNGNVAVAPPKNHSWHLDSINPDRSCSSYAREAVVLWVEGCRGEVLCERNLQRAHLHIFFDARTEIDESTIGAMHRNGTQPIVPGMQVEIEVTLSPDIRLAENVEYTTHYFVRISKISTQGSKKAVPENMILTVSSEPATHATFGYAKGSDSHYNDVIIHPSLFTKEWVHKCVQDNRSFDVLTRNYPCYEQMKSVLRLGRTVRGNVIKAPRWVGDILRAGNNPRRMFISCQPMYRETACVRVSLTQSQLRFEWPSSVFLELDSLDVPGKILCPTVMFTAEEKRRLLSTVKNGELAYRMEVDRRPAGCEQPWIVVGGRGNVLKPIEKADGNRPLVMVGTLVDVNDDLSSDYDAAIENSSLLLLTPPKESTFNDVSTSNSYSYLDDLKGVFLDRNEVSISESLADLTFLDSPMASIDNSAVENSEPLESPTFSPFSTDQTFPVTCFSRSASPVSRCRIRLPSGEFRYGDEPHKHEVVSTQMKDEEEAEEESDKPAAVQVQPQKERVVWTREKLAALRIGAVKIGGQAAAVHKTIIEANLKEKQIEEIPAVDENKTIRFIGVHEDISEFFGFKAFAIRDMLRGPVDRKKPWFVRRDPRVVPTVRVDEFLEKRDWDWETKYDVMVEQLEETVHITNKCPYKIAIPKHARRLREGLASEAREDTLRAGLADMAGQTPADSRPAMEPSSELCNETITAKAKASDGRIMDLLQSDKVFGAFFQDLINKAK